MSQIRELETLFNNFASLFDQLSALQKEKSEAVRQDDLQKVDHCMQQEQALVLQLRGMQRQKDSLHKALGLSGVPLRKISEHLSPADRALLSPSISRFQTAYQIYQSAAAASRALLESTLKEIDRQLSHMKKPASISPNVRGSFTDIKA